MKEAKKIRTIMQDLNVQLKKNFPDEWLDSFIKTVNQQMRKVEKIRVDFIITYWCMMNNQFFLNNPDEQKCPLLKALNLKLMQPNALVSFQKDLMLLRITEYFLWKYFGIKCLKFESLTDNEIMYLEYLTDLIDFEEWNLVSLSKYNYLFLTLEIQPPEKKRTAKAVKKANKKQLGNWTKQVGVLALSKSIEPNEEVKFFFIGLPNPANGSRRCAELNNMVEQVMKVLSEFVKLKISKINHSVEDQSPLVEFKKEGMKKGLRQQLIEEITENVKISDLCYVQLKELVAFDNNIYRVEKPGRKKKDACLVTINIL